MSNGWIGLSKSSERNSRSLTFSMSSFFIAQSGKQFEWVSWCTVIGSKVRGNCKLFCNWVVFLNALYQSWQPLLFTRGPSDNSPLAHNAPFLNVLVDFKVKGIVALVNRFSKLKRILFDKRSILHLPSGFSWSSLYFQKISFENGLRTKKVRFCCIFKFKKIVLSLTCLIIFVLGLLCRYNLLFQKVVCRVLRFHFWKAGKKFHQHNLPHLSSFFSYYELFTTHSRFTDYK